jgi:hypothetical protein
VSAFAAEAAVLMIPRFARSSSPFDHGATVRGGESALRAVGGLRRDVVPYSFGSRKTQPSAASVGLARPRGVQQRPQLSRLKHKLLTSFVASNFVKFR